MSLKEIAFLANWAKDNKEMVRLIAASTKWTEKGIVDILFNLESEVEKAINHEDTFLKQVSELKSIKNNVRK